MSVDSLVATAAFLSDFTQGPTNEDEVQRFVSESRNLQQGINLVLGPASSLMEVGARWLHISRRGSIGRHAVSRHLRGDDQGTTHLEDHLTHYQSLVEYLSKGFKWMTAFTKSITELPQRSQVYVLDSYETIIFRISLLLKQAARVHLRAQGMELTPSD